MSNPRRSAGIGGTERDAAARYRASLDLAVVGFIATARAAAAQIQPRDRWVLLRLFAEAHQHAALAIQGLAEDEVVAGGEEGAAWLSRR
jgi:hypothetical protein